MKFCKESKAKIGVPNIKKYLANGIKAIFTPIKGVTGGGTGVEQEVEQPQALATHDLRVKCSTCSTYPL